MTVVPFRIPQSAFGATAARAVVALALFAASAGPSAAATPKEIDDAIKRGAAAIKAMEANKTPGAAFNGPAESGIGPTALAGLAMLEGGIPYTDPVMKSVADQVRTDAYTQTKTYQISLCLMFLDRLGEPADVPVVQFLALRLLAGQVRGSGGWSYDCCQPPSDADVQRLRAIKPERAQTPPRLHPEVAAYGASIVGKPGGTDDNSNTQFAAIAVWMSRKHGVPVEAALEGIAQHYLTSQNGEGSWFYSLGGGNSSPAMYCSGLIGLAMAIGRREEKRAAKLEKDKPKADPPKKEAAPPKITPDDEFFKPPEEKSKPEAKKPDPKKTQHPKDQWDIAAENALRGLAGVLAQSAQVGKGPLVLEQGKHGYHDLYFFWSLERVCVIYGLEKLGSVEWYEAGADTLVHAQRSDGSWNGAYGGKVCTSFAVLFLCRSNLARDLSGKVQKETNTEMRYGAGPAGNTAVNPNTTSTKPSETTPSAPILPEVSGNDANVMAAKLVKLDGKEWDVLLKRLRDTRGPQCTEALVTAITRLDGDKLKEARQALADRLCRMTAATLRTMAKAEEAELRRGAVLAMAQRDEKQFIPDLIAAITDDEEIVVKAAKAGLKSLTGLDYGPANNATIGEKKIAADAWQDWYSKQKK